MNTLKKSDCYAAGLAIFSMFFGAGNIIFPLALGNYARGQTGYAILGLLLTAVLIPFMGLLAMFLYQGNIKNFFGRVGKGPGLILAFIIITLLGPLGSTPRCIALAYSTFQLSIPSLSSTIFNACSCLLIFLFCYKKNRLMGLLGYVLTPVLILLLGFIILKGFIDAPPLTSIPSSQTPLEFFLYGLKEGYNTMDLLAAFFFAPIVLSTINKKAGISSQLNPLLLSSFILKATIVGATLLAAVYIGFSYLAFYYAGQMASVSSDQLLSMIAFHILGSPGAILVESIVVLACLTTAMALISAFTDFVYKEVFNKKIHYTSLLLGGLILTFFIANFEFHGISKFLGPLLQTIYPALIVLTLFNMGFQFYKLKNENISSI